MPRGVGGTGCLVGQAELAHARNRGRPETIFRNNVFTIVVPPFYSCSGQLLVVV